MSDVHTPAASDTHGVVYAREDCRLDELATRSVMGCAAEGADRTFLFGDGDVVEYFLILRRCCDRADMGIARHGVTDGGLFRDLDQSFDELVVDRALHQQS